MKNVLKYFILLVLAVVLMPACVEHEVEAEPLPQEAVTFTYVIVGGNYTLDYYIDSDIQFINTSVTEGTATWDFGDGTVVTTDSDTCVHSYLVAGTYNVKLTIAGITKEQPLMIADIKPILTIDSLPDGVCKVRETLVKVNLELPNPKNRGQFFKWKFPEGAKWADGTDAITYESEYDTLPQKLLFSHVGSQNIQVTATLGDGDTKRELEKANINVQVGYNQKVPTLYYAEKEGNIKAFKLVTNEAEKPADMNINPFDLAISSGQHPFNLVFADSTLFLIDAGKQFYYINDADGVMGDGKILAIAQDGSRVETVITNVGGPAFQDPFYGYAENGNLYYADRNTGIIKLRTKDRNKVYSADEFPYHVQNNTLQYYNVEIQYGSGNACFTKFKGTWYWCKYFNGTGVLRFKDSEISDEAIANGDLTKFPADGIALNDMTPKSIACSDRHGIFFTLIDEGYNAFYACPTLDQFNAVKTKTEVSKYEVKCQGQSLAADKTGKRYTFEGHGTEIVGICQLAIDELTGCVYFGWRPEEGSTLKPGLMRYNPATGTVEYVIEGAEVYGVAINPEVSYLF